MTIIGHRGAKGLAAENTIASITAGLEAGANMIECDVRLTSDNIPVLHHDRKLLGSDGRKRLIGYHTFEALSRYKGDLTTLASAIETVDRRVCLVIEVKRGENVAPIAAVIREYLSRGWTREHLLIASKSMKTLQELQKALPELPLGVIDAWSSIRATARARRLHTRILFMNHHWLWSGVVRRLRQSGYELYPYTVNTPKRQAALIRMGVAGIITDYPDRAVSS